MSVGNIIIFVVFVVLDDVCVPIFIGRQSLISGFEVIYLGSVIHGCIKHAKRMLISLLTLHNIYAYII